MEPKTADTVLRGVTPPAQRRSRETLERILAATERLLDGRSFADISVLEICTEADVSASSFYARFSSKERLLAVLHQHHLDHQRARVDAVAADLQATELDVPALMLAAATVYLGSLVDDAPLIQTLRLAEIDDLALADRRRALDRYVAGVVADGIIAVMDDPDAALRRRVHFATRAACAAMQDAVQAPHAFAEDLTLDVGATARETVDMWLRYVYQAPLPEGIAQAGEPAG